MTQPHKGGTKKDDDSDSEGLLRRIFGCPSTWSIFRQGLSPPSESVLDGDARRCLETR